MPSEKEHRPQRRRHPRLPLRCTQVTNTLEKTLEHLVSHEDEAAFAAYEVVATKHKALAEAMGLADAEFEPVAGLLSELHKLLQGIQLTREVSPRLQARVSSFGELMSSHLGLAYLRHHGLDTLRLDARDILVTVDDPRLSEADRFLEADVQPVVDPQRINKHVPAESRIVITQGFLATTPKGETALLGRGGSDTSASLFGALLDAHRIEIWTDVHGMFTADPRLVPGARLLRHLSYREAQELAAMGAKVLHARCLPPARVAQVPVEIRNTLDPQLMGEDGAEVVLQRTRIGVSGVALGVDCAESTDSGTAAAAGEAGSLVVPSSMQNKRHSIPSAASIPGEALASVASTADGSLTVGETGVPAARILAVARRRGVTMITMAAFSMWGEAGFLTKVFQPFSDAGVSVDLIATSQYAVSVTLDYIPGGPTGTPFQRVLLDLKKVCSVTVQHDCAVVSIVGRALRTVLPQLGLSMSVMQGIPVHMLSEATEDLNLSFVVDGEHGDTLLKALHENLLSTPQAGLATSAAQLQFGMSWSALAERARTSPLVAGGHVHTGAAAAVEPPPLPPLDLPPSEGEGRVPVQWWTDASVRQQLLGVLSGDGDCAYVYNVAQVRARAAHLRSGVPAVNTWLYAMKANDHPAVLRAMGDAGFGYECVSYAEVQHCLKHGTPGARLVFTPNFCPVSEYAAAFAAGAEVIIDGPEVLLQAPGVFKGQRVGLRIDPNAGDGHHNKVITSGPGQKFGCDQASLLDAAAAAEEVGCLIVGLHAHSGSGIRDPQNWVRVAQAHFQAAALLKEDGQAAFPHLQWVDLGGGLGVEHGHEHSTLHTITSASTPPASVVQPSVAVQAGALAAALAPVAEQARGLERPLEIRMEPGRYCVAPAGVLLTRVTQQRTKGGRRYVGASTGMNSLIRPALYGSYHSIVNLSRAGSEPDASVTVVGPICESGDVLGTDVLLPSSTAPGDVLLITNAGAYGRVMASSYNMREPAREVVLGASQA